MPLTPLNVRWYGEQDQNTGWEICYREAIAVRRTPAPCWSIASHDLAYTYLHVTLCSTDQTKADSVDSTSASKPYIELSAALARSLLNTPRVRIAVTRAP